MTGVKDLDIYIYIWKFLARAVRRLLVLFVLLLPPLLVPRLLSLVFRLSSLLSPRAAAAAAASPSPQLVFKSLKFLPFSPSLALTAAVFAFTSLTVMDSGACTDMCDKCKDSCFRSSEKLDESIVILEANKDVPKLPEATDCTDSLEPITPDADRENGDFPIDFKSPLTVMRKPLKLSCIDSNSNDNVSKLAFVDNDSPQTPKDGVFDPFAPGPDNLARAPQCKKYLDELRGSVARRLNFNPSFDVAQHENLGDEAESLSDQEMFESVYENLLEAIVSMQTEGVLAEISSVEFDSGDCKTPPSALQLSGVADTCPGAPVKPGNKPRIIHLELCRKLEF